MNKEICECIRNDIQELLSEGTLEVIISRMLQAKYKVIKTASNRIAKECKDGNILSVYDIQEIINEELAKIPKVKKEPKRHYSKKVPQNFQKEKNSIALEQILEESTHTTKKQLTRKEIDEIIITLCTTGTTLKQCEIGKKRINPEDIQKIRNRITELRSKAKEIKKFGDRVISPDEDMITVLDYITGAREAALETKKLYVKKAWDEPGIRVYGEKNENKNGRLRMMLNRYFQERDVCSLVFVIENLKWDKYVIEFRKDENIPNTCPDIREYKMYKDILEKKISKLTMETKRQQVDSVDELVR